MSKSRVIGVLGTEATVRQPYVDDLAARFAADCAVIRHGSPELVALAEAKLAGKPVAGDQLRAAIAPMFAKPFGMEIDVIVLACTHFPLLADEIAVAFPGVALVDGGAGIARRIAQLTQRQPWPPEAAPPGIAIFTAAPSETLRASYAAYSLTKVLTL